VPSDYRHALGYRHPQRAGSAEREKTTDSVPVSIALRRQLKVQLNFRRAVHIASATTSRCSRWSSSESKSTDTAGTSTTCSGAFAVEAANEANLRTCIELGREMELELPAATPSRDSLWEPGLGRPSRLERPFSLTQPSPAGAREQCKRPRWPDHSLFVDAPTH
jgi:hypothetical protein